MSPTSSSENILSGTKSALALALSKSPTASARIAPIKSANVPLISLLIAVETSTAEWAIIPGRINPTEKVNKATTTKISSSATINAA